MGIFFIITATFSYNFLLFPVGIALDYKHYKVSMPSVRSLRLLSAQTHSN